MIVDEQGECLLACATALDNLLWAPDVESLYYVGVSFRSAQRHTCGARMRSIVLGLLLLCAQWHVASAAQFALETP